MASADETTSVPSSSVFVGDLPGTIEEDAVTKVFGAYGNVKYCKMLQASQHGKRGAILEFETLEEAAWIIENVNGNIPQGLAEPVVVKYKEAKPWGKAPNTNGDGSDQRWTPYETGKDSGKGSGKGGGKNGGKSEGTSINVLVSGLYESGALPGGQKWSNDDGTLFVSGLPSDTTDTDLYKIFTPFGATYPRGVCAMKGPDGKCKGFGFVNFLDVVAAQKAISTLNGTTLPDGQVLRVQVKQAKSQGGQSKGSGKGQGK